MKVIMVLLRAQTMIEMTTTIMRMHRFVSHMLQVAEYIRGDGETPDSRITSATGDIKDGTSDVPRDEITDETDTDNCDTSVHNLVFKTDSSSEPSFIFQHGCTHDSFNR